MFERLAELKKRILEKKSKTGILIGASFSMIFITGTLLGYFFWDDIKATHQRKLAEKNQPQWADENLGEINEEEYEDPPVEIKEYLTDSNGYSYVKQNLFLLNCSIPIPTEFDQWEMKYECEKFYAVNKVYNGMYGNIEYGIFPIDSAQYLPTVYDVQNVTMSKMAMSFPYHGFNTTFRSMNIQDQKTEILDNGTMIITPTQTFKEFHDPYGSYMQYYSRYYIIPANENEYYILYGIAPSNKDEYLNDMLDMVSRNFSTYKANEISVSYYPPAIEKTVVMNTINIALPDNLESSNAGTYRITDNIFSPLAGTYVTITQQPASAEKGLGNFNLFLQNMFADVCGRTDALDAIQKYVGINDIFSEQISNSEDSKIWLCKGAYSYNHPDIISFAPFGNKTKIMGYIIETGNQDTLIAATYTDTNEQFVKKYLQNIVNHSQ